MAVRKNAPRTPTIAYTLRVILREVRTKIWRRLSVPHDIGMDRLHTVLQLAFGWTNSHLHQFHLFDARGKITGYVQMDPREDPFEFPDSFPAPKVFAETECALRDFLVKPGDRIGYEYDFGDSWLHEIALEEAEVVEHRLAHASCLGGARACPPEDCGGPPGFERLVRILKTPKHRERPEMLAWLGGEFDPAAFDAEATSGLLKIARV